MTRDIIQNNALNLSREYNHILLTWATGCHEKGHPIMMSNGSIKEVQDIQIGDTIMGKDSLPRVVLRLHNGKENMYTIHPKRGESFTVNENHILSLKRTTVPKRKEKYYPEVQNVSVKEYNSWSKYRKHLYKLYKTEIKFYGEVLEPYFIGLWLGDSSSNSASITTVDNEILSYINDLADKYQLKVRVNKIAYHLSRGNNLNRENKLHSLLKSLDILKNKHIPDIYLKSSREHRLQLLAGLIDSDGHLCDGVVEISQTREQLANQIVFLARSLGFYSSIRSKTTSCSNCSNYEGVAYRVIISGDLSIIPCLVERKKYTGRRNKNCLLTGFKVEDNGVGDYYGFTVDKDHLYVDGNFFVHHNCGKTKAALNIAKEGGLWLIVCKEITHIENWRREISKFDPEGTEILPKIVDIICYASLQKWRNTDDINLILDEVHALSELRELRISDMKPSKIVSLSATVDADVRMRLESIAPFKEYHISTSDAIGMGILPEPKVFVVYTNLDDKDKIYTAKYGKKTIDLTAKGYYSYISDKIDYWKKRWEAGETWAENKFKMFALERKKWLALYKTSLAQSILKVIGERRFICFTGSIEQCNMLGGTNVVHSKINPKKREKMIEDLNAGILNSLFCVNMMRESINITSIEAGMIVQLDGSSDRSFIQTLGRTLRGEKPEFFVLVVKGTKDEDYFRNATYNFDKKYLYVWQTQ